MAGRKLADGGNSAERESELMNGITGRVTHYPSECFSKVCEHRIGIFRV